jgi:hypothetical protein
MNGNYGLIPSNYTTTLEVKSMSNLKLATKASSRVLQLQQDLGFSKTDKKPVKVEKRTKSQMVPFTYK